MCLQGFDQSGQEHSVQRSWPLRGNIERPATVKVYSMLSGRMPENRLAAMMGCYAITVLSFSQSSGLMVSTVMATS